MNADKRRLVCFSICENPLNLRYLCSINCIKTNSSYSGITIGKLGIKSIKRGFPIT